MPASENTSQQQKNMQNIPAEQGGRPAALLRIPGTDYSIDPSAPLPQYSKPHARAFRAVKPESEKKLIALLTGRPVIPRFKQFPVFKSFYAHNLQQYYESGTVYWPEDETTYYACIFEEPRGISAMNRETGEIRLQLGYETAGKPIVARFIEPAVNLLNELKKHNVTHGALNLNNIYMRKENNASVMFGECLTAPPAYEQSALFEPVGRALADPVARGHATEKHDLYALGICTALIAQGKNPLAGAKRGEIIARKIDLGSFAAITGKERLSPGLSEFLRAVLHDELSSRWSLEDALRWLDGSRMTVKPARAAPKAARAFSFGEYKYSHLRSLVIALARNPNMTAQTLKDKKLLEWLGRNISDKHIIANFERHFGADKNPAENYDSSDLMVAHATIALDPESPIRFKTVSVMPHGFGTALAHAVLHGEDIKPYWEILQYQLYAYWFEMQFIHLPEAGSMTHEMEKARAFLKQKMIGRGFERCLYMLCKDAHCLSPMIKDAFIRNGADLLAVYEGLAASGKLPALDNFFDRHIIAFLIVHESQVIEPFVSMIASPQAGRKLTGLAHCFAAIQRKADGKAAPHLVAWFVRNIRPALDKIHDRQLRQRLFDRVQKLKDETHFDSLLDIIDDPEILHEDRRKFLAARAEFRALLQERVGLQRQLSGKQNMGMGTGRQAAMLVSLAMSLLVTALTVLTHFHIL